MNALAREVEQLGGDINAVLDDLPLPGILLDGDGIMRWQNKAALKCKGDQVGASFADYVAPRDRLAASVIVRRMLVQGEAAEFRLHVVNARGKCVSAEFSAVPVRGGGRVVGIFGLSRLWSRTRAVCEKAGFDLTERQREVLGLLADGRSTDEIARHLWISRTTVRNHIANIITALGVHTRLQAVVLARREGLLDS